MSSKTNYVYYNEFDPEIAEWLQNLIKKGVLPDGEVDTRSIVDVKPEEIVGFTHYHFFAGIGGWALAAKYANFSQNTPLVTGSAPCQPFSVAGKKKGENDERHLWSELFRIYKDLQVLNGWDRRSLIVGEQVDSKLALSWLDGVFNDLQSINHTTGAASLSGQAVNSPQIRQRIYWFGKKTLADSVCFGCDGEQDNTQQEQEQRIALEWTSSSFKSDTTMEHSYVSRLERLSGHGDNDRGAEPNRPVTASNICAGTHGTFPNPWLDSPYIQCYDANYRRAEPRIPLLADGLPNYGVSFNSTTFNEAQKLKKDLILCRKTIIHGLGNAIIPQLGALFLKSIM